jgi:hypothetical protein
VRARACVCFYRQQLLIAETGKREVKQYNANLTVKTLRILIHH